ncbi:MAG: type II toxin-antitoxin system RelB/DinJ family antitoxin [Kiritimatiellae bacterium]|nr:type II toxin-antitoxin system RelB/DinJ family antitoxin [Kiritimatiellia bacterium]
MAQINFRIDDKTKREAEALFGRMGLTMSGAIMVFLRQSINERGIPFKLCLPASTLTEEELLRRVDDVENGCNCHYHDLIEVDEEENATPKVRSRRITHRHKETVA